MAQVISPFVCSECKQKYKTEIEAKNCCLSFNKLSQKAIETFKAASDEFYRKNKENKNG